MTPSALVCVRDSPRPAFLRHLSGAHSDGRVVRARQQHPGAAQTGVHPHQLPGGTHRRRGAVGHGDLAARARTDARNLRPEERRARRLRGASDRHHADDRRGHAGRLALRLLDPDGRRGDARGRQRHDRGRRQSAGRRALSRSQDDAPQLVPRLLSHRHRRRRPCRVRARHLRRTARLLAVSAGGDLHPDPRLRRAWCCRSRFRRPRTPRPACRSARCSATR